MLVRLAARTAEAEAMDRNDASGSSGSRLIPAGRSNHLSIALNRGPGSNGAEPPSIVTRTDTSSRPSPSLSEPDREPSIRDQVENGRVLGNAQRIVKRRLENARAETQPLGASGDGPKEDEGRREIAIVEKVMLCTPDRVESQALGFLREVEHLVIDLALRARISRMALACDVAEPEADATHRRA